MNQTGEWAKQEKSSYQMLTAFLKELGVASPATASGFDEFYDCFKLQCAREIAEDVREEAGTLAEAIQREKIDGGRWVTRRRIVMRVADRIVESNTP